MKICNRCGHTFRSDGWTCPKCNYEPGQSNGFVLHAPELAFSGGGFRPEAFKNLATLESSNFWFRARNHLILWALDHYSVDVDSFLEVGCGTGFVLSGLSCAKPRLKLSGSEIFLAGLPYASKRVPNANLMQMDARRIPFDTEFDVIGAFDVLEHIPEDEMVLTQIYKALNPGGLLLVTVPQHPWLWSKTDDYACHVRRYTLTELRNKTIRAGFEIMRTTSFVSLLLPAMLLSRRRKSGAHAKHEIDTNQVFDPCTELRLPKPLNAMLYSIMRMECELIKMGLNFRIGGSRLMIARKLRRK